MSSKRGTALYPVEPRECIVLISCSEKAAALSLPPPTRKSSASAVWDRWWRSDSETASPKPAAPKPPQKAGPSREDTAKVKERCMAKVLILVDQGVITSGQVEKYYEEMVEDELSKLR